MLNNLNCMCQLEEEGWESCFVTQSACCASYWKRRKVLPLVKIISFQKIFSAWLEVRWEIVLSFQPVSVEHAHCGSPLLFCETQKNINLLFHFIFFPLNLALQFSELDVDEVQCQQIQLLQQKLGNLCAGNINGHAMPKMIIAVLYTSVLFFITCKNHFCITSPAWKLLILVAIGKTIRFFYLEQRECFFPVYLMIQ